MALAHPVGLGVLFGPLIGTQVGITAASWIVVRFGLARCPAALIQTKSTARRFQQVLVSPCPSLSATSPSGANYSSGFLKSVSGRARLFASRLVTTFCDRR